MSTRSPSLVSSTAPEERLLNLKVGLHRAYCVAICLDRALRYNAADDAPELAVCVHEYLVRPLDALSIEANELIQAFATSIRETELKDEARGGVE